MGNGEGRVIEILAGNVYSQILDVRYHQETTRVLDKAFTVKVPTAWFSPKFKKGFWDGTVHFFKSSGRFHTGFLPEVVKILDGIPTPYLVKGLPPIPSLAPVVELKGGFKLREYQEEALKVVLKEGRGILQMATNSGKTEVAIALIESTRHRALWLTHSRDLLSQTQERIQQRTNFPTSTCTSGKMDWGGEIVLATVQTLFSSLGKKKGAEQVKRALALFKMVILDECHLGTATSWRSILEAMPNAHYRVGLSGTPFTRDPVRDRDLVGCLGPVLYRASNEEMITQGVSAKPKVVQIGFDHCSYGDYHTSYQRGILDNQKRNGIISRIVSKMEASQVGLIIVDRLIHGRALLMALEPLMPNQVVFLNGGEKLEVREKAIQDVKAGKLRAIIATKIFDLGIDLPQLDYLVLASPTKSLVMVLQRIGRVLRTRAGKKEAVVYDFNDKGDKYLERHSKERYKIYKSEGFEVERW